MNITQSLKELFSGLFYSLATLSLSFFVISSAHAAEIVFDDPSMASHNVSVINQAIADTGKFSKPSGGNIYIDSPIICRKFCLIEGETDAHSPIVISQSFIGSEVIITASVAPSLELKNVKFLFDQNRTASTRSELHPFPPFIKGIAPRAKIIDVTISGGIDGIIAEGNAGGMFIDRVKLGNFGTNLKIDGALDFVFLDKIEVWPFDYSRDLLDVWSDSKVIAYHFREVDGLTAGSLTSFRGKAIIEAGAGLISNRPKGPFGSISSLHLDGNDAGLMMSKGFISIANFYSTSAKLDDIAIDLRGGNLNIANVFVTGGLSLNSSFGLISVSGGTFQYGNLTSKTFNDHTNIVVDVDEDDIRKLYRVVLQRNANEAGYALWSGELNRGRSLASIAKSFVASAEAFALYGVDFGAASKENQIILLYKALLRRESEPSQAEVDHWSVYPIDTVIKGFLNSPEYARL